MDREYDGFRILVTRFTPRGVKGTRYHAWMPNLAPSEPLLKGFQAKEIDWETFSQRYEEELFQPAPLDKLNRKIKNHGQKFTLRLLKELAKRQALTLMCSCEEDKPHCHRHLLKDLLKSKKI